MLVSRVKDPDLGLRRRGCVGKHSPHRVRAGRRVSPLMIAPVGICSSDDPEYHNSLLNINADTAAGEIARALGAEKMVFMTDVEGVLDRNRRLIPRLTVQQAKQLSDSGTISGGMIPKIEACVNALVNDSSSHIIDGRSPGALRRSLSGEKPGHAGRLGETMAEEYLAQRWR